MKLILIALTLMSFINGFKNENLLIRKSVKNLSFKEWQEFREGIRRMKTLNIRNPLGFYYQANIHGWGEYNGTDIANFIADKYNWHKCTHHQYFFLPWHRMYMFLFERILRAATGNPRFTIPYWDHHDKSQRQLPEPFRIPANEEKNSLYSKGRCEQLNRGKPLSAEMTDPLPALRSSFFTANQSSNDLNVCHSFGGGRIQRPEFEKFRGGLLEHLPHDMIHLYVGGADGIMSDLCTSAQDPLFWVHHTTIDRIWESWTQLGGKNLMEEPYLRQTFKFFNERGILCEYMVKDFLNITKLGYKYDSLIKADRVEPTQDETPKLYISVDETKDLVINSTKRSIVLEIKQNYSSLFKKIAKGEINATKIRFTLQTVLDIMMTKYMYQLYLNLPDGVTPYENTDNYLGDIVLFEERCVPRPPATPMGITHCFDITDNLIRIIQKEYDYNLGVPTHLKLTILPKSCDTVYFPEDAKYLIQFQRTYLTHYFLKPKKS